MYDDQPPQQSYPIQNPMFSGGHTSEGALLIHLECNEIINEIEHLLKGEIEMYENGKMSWRKIGQPILNDTGVNNIITILKSRLTKVFILSDLDSEQIEKITIDIGRVLIDDLYYNWDEYGLKDDAAASQVLHLVTDTVYATLRKGYMGNYLKFLRTTQSIQEVQHRSISEMQRQQPSQDQNIIGRLFNRKRR